jgi:hypothetical protein
MTWRRGHLELVSRLSPALTARTGLAAFLTERLPCCRRPSPSNAVLPAAHRQRTDSSARTCTTTAVSAAALDAATRNHRPSHSFASAICAPSAGSSGRSSRSSVCSSRRRPTKLPRSATLTRTPPSRNNVDAAWVRSLTRPLLPIGVTTDPNSNRSAYRRSRYQYLLLASNRARRAAVTASAIPTPSPSCRYSVDARLLAATSPTGRAQPSTAGAPASTRASAIDAASTAFGDPPV